MLIKKLSMEGQTSEGYVCECGDVCMGMHCVRGCTCVRVGTCMDMHSVRVCMCMSVGTCTCVCMVKCVCV